MALSAGTRLGSYEILEPLGAGGMGEVYRARDTRLGRDVAVKVLPADRLSDPARRARFEQEARAASQLNHPHIVTIHEIESAEGTALPPCGGPEGRAAGGEGGVRLAGRGTGGSGRDAEESTALERRRGRGHLHCRRGGGRRAVAPATTGASQAAPGAAQLDRICGARQLLA